ncbi:preprotein translocase subunit SecE [Pisciglobus halotolerans]|uniref:Protein translocase subunit SecE n=1 Tax=Pisciglobus halotolerans TaxID=745365 RepID=A0A1I3B6S7_9LACT|nr:preprotein translocase subunit SecE [Pisciglobus halotolerans]SFH57796.1 protein translocase subunit secE/sec61 gamma [Pisciglobus halotolerans]
MGKMKNFFSDVIHEMKVVTWPTKKEMSKHIPTVFSVVAFFAVFFFAVDYVLTTLLDLLI